MIRKLKPSGNITSVSCRNKNSGVWPSLRILLTFSLTLLLLNSNAQVLLDGRPTELNHVQPSKFTIGGITVSGVEFLDHSVIIILAGLAVGDRIEVPGEAIRTAIEKLWAQGLFENIQVTATRIDGDVIFLNLHMQERPRLTRFSFKGIRRPEADDLREKIKIARGDVVTDHLIMRTTQTIRNHFSGKGHLYTDVNIRQVRDTASINNVELIIEVEKGNRVRIDQINILGNNAFDDHKVKRQMDNTKERGLMKPFNSIDSLLINTARAALRLDIHEMAESVINAVTNDIRPRIFKSSKFIEDEFEEDKINIIKKYNELGYRDARVVRDSVIMTDNGMLVLNLYIDEGPQYFFRAITWVGNTKYTSEVLSSVLGIQPGDVFNQTKLDTHLSYNPNGIDVSSLYLDDGYLFFRVIPVEVRVENDSIDLEMRIFEGKQATINRVSIKGNTRTSDHVVLRELRTRPGHMFNRSDIIRSVRDLAQLRYFDPEKINPVPIPNPEEGTVDIVYEVEETSSDQVELSGGWGYGRIIGTLGLSFNNFSTRRFFQRDAWRPVPTGDGQKLSLRMQSFGRGFVSYSASFTEPWLGGRRPNTLSVSYFHSLFSNALARDDANYSAFKIDGLTVMLGQRINWPDDFFILSQNLSLQQYDLTNYTRVLPFGTGTGTFNSISYGITFGRRSVDQPIYPRSGTDFTISLNLTPPYSLFSGRDYSAMSEDERFKWIEYHKWNLSAAWYQTVVGNLVVSVRSRYGFLGLYNRDIGITPFERFFLGGDGLQGHGNFDGREIIAFRGYANESLTPGFYRDRTTGATIFNKNTFEIRYPVSLNPSATIFVMGFAEVGNAWADFGDFNPFSLKRSAGVGVRVFLPMFGLLGLDWGYGFDEVKGMPGANRGQFHFSIGQSID